MKKKVTFIVRAVTDKSQTIRCLNSIYRQNNEAFDVIVITNIGDFSEELTEKYENIKCVYIKRKKSYINAANKRIKKLKTRYFIFVNSDTVFPPNAVDMFLKSGKQLVLFNIAKLFNHNFAPLYSNKEDEFKLDTYIKNGVNIWNNVISTEYVIKNGLFLKSLDSFDQLMYILALYSGADSYDAINDVLAYKPTITQRREISYDEFSENSKELKKFLKSFSEKGMSDVIRQVVFDFVISNINVYYEEKSFFKKLMIKRRFRKYICI